MERFAKLKASMLLALVLLFGISSLGAALDVNLKAYYIDGYWIHRRFTKFSKFIERASTSSSDRIKPITTGKLSSMAAKSYFDLSATVEPAVSGKGNTGEGYDVEWTLSPKPFNPEGLPWKQAKPLQPHKCTMGTAYYKPRTPNQGISFYLCPGKGVALRKKTLTTKLGTASIFSVKREALNGIFDKKKASKLKKAAMSVIIDSDFDAQAAPAEEGLAPQFILPSPQQQPPAASAAAAADTADGQQNYIVQTENFPPPPPPEPEVIQATS